MREGIARDAGAPTVAVFDLDGTLARGCSISRFLFRVAGTRGLLRAGAAGLRSIGLPPDRGASKEAAVGAVLRGRYLRDVQAMGDRFAADVVARRLHPRTLDEVTRLRDEGADLVILSAALDVYVQPIADLLDFTDTISTVVEATDGVCTGRLRDSDLHGARKVDRLRAWLGEREGHVRVVAFGNSRDDRALLDYADAGAAV